MKEITRIKFVSLYTLLVLPFTISISIGSQFIGWGAVDQLIIFIPKVLLTGLVFYLVGIFLKKKYIVPATPREIMLQVVSINIFLFIGFLFFTSIGSVANNLLSSQNDGISFFFAIQVFMVYIARIFGNNFVYLLVHSIINGFMVYISLQPQKVLESNRGS